jgi:hypothetical protein
MGITESLLRRNVRSSFVDFERCFIALDEMSTVIQVSNERVREDEVCT